MLIRSTWTLKVNQETLIPTAYNISLIKLLSQKMGLEFGEQTIPNLTFSGILGKFTRNNDFYCLSPENEYHLSLSGLENKSSKAIQLLDLNQKLDFFGASFKITNRTDKITTYEEIYSQLIAQEPEAIKNYKIDFLTPTSFAQNQIYLPLPLPSLMFRSWLEKWNHFCNIYLGSTELIQYLSNNIYLNYHSLNTRKFPIHQQKITGFVGYINLKIPQSVDDLLANVANLLINYAEYAGTGIKTRLGMGHTSVQSD